LRADINATTNADLQALSGVSDLTGYLAISGSVTDVSALACLTHVSGNLVIRKADVLTSFALPRLASLGGSLVASEAARLTTVSLPVLASLGGDLGRSVALEFLPAFTSLDLRALPAMPSGFFITTVGSTAKPISLELPSLAAIGGELSLSSVNGLKDANAFLALQSIGGALDIRSGGFGDLDGLRGVTEIGAGLNLSELSVARIDLGALTKLGRGQQDLCNFANLPQLATLRVGKLGKALCDLTFLDIGGRAATVLAVDFGALTEVAVGLRITRVNNLADLRAFANLATLGRGLLVSENDALETAVLPALASVAGSVDLDNDRALTQISLPSLTSLGGDLSLVHLLTLKSASLPLLTTIPGGARFSELAVSNAVPLTLDLRALTKVAEGLTLASAINLIDLSGLAKVAEVGGRLAVDSNPYLATLSLPALAKVGGRLQITDDKTLSAVSLASLASLGSEDSVSLLISQLPGLTSLRIPELVSVPANLELRSASTAGVPLTLAFDKLTIIGSTLRLDSNRGLTTLAGLGALTTVNGSLLVSDMDALTSFAPWSALSAVRGSLSISNNDLLPTCQATALVTRLMSTVAGSFVAGNAPDACGP
jgi:hypothetical protein